MVFKSDVEMFNLMEKQLYTAVCSDVLDEFGYRNQAMRQNIRPASEDMVAIGRAKTILAVDVYEIKEDNYKIEIEAVDSVRPGDIVVACTNESTQNSLWGELMSTATRARGGRGAVVDGLARDIKKIKEMNFPLFFTGYKPIDSKGRGTVIDYDCPVMCGGVMVHPGDLIFGDIDGIIVIPKSICKEVIVASLEKVSKENATRKELQNGLLLSDVFKKYGVL